MGTQEPESGGCVAPSGHETCCCVRSPAARCYPAPFQVRLRCIAVRAWEGRRTSAVPSVDQNVCAKYAVGSARGSRWGWRGAGIHLRATVQSRARWQVEGTRLTRPRLGTLRPGSGQRSIAQVTGVRTFQPPAPSPNPRYARTGLGLGWTPGESLVRSRSNSKLLPVAPCAEPKSCAVGNRNGTRSPDGS